MKAALAALILTAWVAPAQAQSHYAAPGYYGPPGPAAIAEQHRIEMDRLRAASDRQADFARDLARERQMIRDRQARAAYGSETAPVAPRALRSPQEERALREQATARREAVQQGVGQIDAWLDRPRRP